MTMLAMNELPPPSFVLHGIKRRALCILLLLLSYNLSPAVTSVAETLLLET